MSTTMRIPITETASVVLTLPPQVTIEFLRFLVEWLSHAPSEYPKEPQP